MPHTPTSIPHSVSKRSPSTATVCCRSSQGKRREPHEYLYWHWATNRAVRKGDWKLAWDKHDRTWELYDIAADRTEAQDLAPEHPELVAELTEKWNAWAKMTDVNVEN